MGGINNNQWSQLKIILLISILGIGILLSSKYKESFLDTSVRRCLVRYLSSGFEKNYKIEISERIGFSNVLKQLK